MKSFVAACIAGAVVSPALGNIISNDIRTAYRFNDLTFGGAAVDLGHQLRTQPRFAGDTVSLNWFAPATSTGHTVTGIENAVIRNLSVMPGPDAVRLQYNVLHALNAPGLHSYSSSATPDGFRLRVAFESGQWKMHVNYNGGAALSARTLLVTLPGDWSARGNATGQIVIANVNPQWSVQQNFVFDGVNTLFRASAPSSVSDNAQLRFTLHGIPAPGVLPVLAMGLVAARRRRAETSARRL